MKKVLRYILPAATVLLVGAATATHADTPLTVRARNKARGMETAARAHFGNAEAAS